MHKLISLFVGGLCLFWAACSSHYGASTPPPSSRPNIVWINVEDIGPVLGCYGDSLAHTPNLDRLASQGVVYKNAYSTAPICSPSRSSFVTGVYSTSMGSQHLRSEIQLPEFIQPLPQILNGHGYFTTNYGKTDWNFSDEDIFDYWEQELAPWRQRPKGQPFYSTFVLGGTHEGAVNHQDRYLNLTAALPDSLRHDATHFPVPAFFPERQPFPSLMAHYYDLVSQMDREVGELLANLEEDGLMDETIILFFSDHGFGLPRHKRYLYRSGTHVPLLVYMPEKYKDLNPAAAGAQSEQLVSLVDLVPSMLNVLDIEQPDYMQGQAFLGSQIPSPREYVYLERSRADDLFELSRGITDGRYLYVRNYMPYLPYIRSGRIQADAQDKIGYSALRSLHDAGELLSVTERLFHSKPMQELYDWQTDPDEMYNLAQTPDQQVRMAQLHQQLNAWTLDSRDVGFLPEPEYMIRAEGSSPYEVAQNPRKYDLVRTLKAAEEVGTQDEATIIETLQYADGGVAYWGVIASRSVEQPSQTLLNALTATLTHASPSVQIAAAEALCSRGLCDKALPVLQKWVADERSWLALQAARSTVEIGASVAPIIPELEEIRQSYLNADPEIRWTYRDFYYASFIGWALEQAIENGGGL